MEFQHINPEHVIPLFRGSVQKRLKDAKYWRARGYKLSGPCGPYHGRSDAGTESRSFYLDSDFMPGLRYQWADDIVNLRHTGWFADQFQDEKIRGMVFTLPHGRGFLAGWSMGEGMISALETYIYADQESAAYAADSTAEHIAELNRESEDQDDQDAA